jgi:ADP-ribose pyrophosphatase YjhB (NUDIX family)
MDGSGKSSNQFTIRVYGILQDKSKSIMVADAFQHGMLFTKFPGGGLEFGEGTKDCLIREWGEELGQQIKIAEHLYTTDFFQISAFNQKQQVISIYYRVVPLDEPKIKISDIPFDFTKKEGAESFRWISLTEFHEKAFTFPIDKIVARKIREQL